MVVGFFTLLGISILGFLVLFSLYIILSTAIRILWENYMKLLVTDIYKHQYAIIKRFITIDGHKVYKIDDYSSSYFEKVTPSLDDNSKLIELITDLDVIELYYILTRHYSGDYNFNNVWFHIASKPYHHRLGYSYEKSAQTFKHYPRLKPFAYLYKRYEKKALGNLYQKPNSIEIYIAQLLMIYDFLTCSFQKLFVILQRKFNLNTNK